MVSGCPKPHKAKNLCIKHYQEVYYSLHKPNFFKRQQGMELGHLIGTTREEGMKIIGTVWTVIADALRRNEKVKLPGLGTFLVKNRKATFIPSQQILDVLNSERVN